MNKERLVIKNFGPIKSMDLELGKMTILIGEQATGKSTIAKVLAVCRYVDLLNADLQQLELFRNTLKFWNIDLFLKKDTYIYYENEDFSKELNNNDFTYKPKSDFIISYLESLKGFYAKNNINFTDIDNTDFEFINSLTISVNSVLETSFFIPTERGLQSIFSLGKGSINNMSDVLFEQLSKLSSITKSFNQEVLIKPIGVKYLTKNDKGFVKKFNEKTAFSIENSASGYQSLIPIVLSVYNYKGKHKNFIIEEPELNLFPKAQKKLMEFFVENINTNQHSFLLPTHSPYILSSLNNLLYAYHVGHLNHGQFKEKVDKVIPEKYWLNPNEISVYYLKDNGTCIDIFDTDENLINTDYIDSVSREISKEFDELLSMEVSFINKELYD